MGTSKTASSTTLKHKTPPTSILKKQKYEASLPPLARRMKALLKEQDLVVALDEKALIRAAVMKSKLKKKKKVVVSNKFEKNEKKKETNEKKVIEMEMEMKVMMQKQIGIESKEIIDNSTNSTTTMNESTLIYTRY